MLKFAMNWTDDGDDCSSFGWWNYSFSVYDEMKLKKVRCVLEKRKRQISKEYF